MSNLEIQFKLLDGLTIPACIMDNSANFLYTNTHFRELLDSEDNEIKLDESNSYFREYRANLAQAFTSAVKGNTDRTFAVVKSGEAQPQGVEIYFFPLIEENQTEAVMALLNPVEDRILSFNKNTSSLVSSKKTSYESTMYDYSFQAVARLNKECSIISCSTSFTALTGLDEKEEAFCKSLFVYDHERIRHGVSNILQNNLSFFRMGEVKIITNKKTPGYVNIVMFPIIEEGKVIAAELIMDDLTREKELENKISSMNKIEMLQDLTHGFLHTLNNTMNVILNQSQFLEQSAHKETTLKRVKVIVESSSAIIEQINRYQNFISDSYDEGQSDRTLIDLLHDAIEFSRIQFKVDERDKTRDISIEKKYYSHPIIKTNPGVFKELAVAIILKVASYIKNQGTLTITLKTNKDVSIIFQSQKSEEPANSAYNTSQQGITSSSHIRHLAEKLSVRFFEEESATEYGITLMIPERLIGEEKKESLDPPEYKLRDHDILIVEDEPALQLILYELFNNMGNRVVVTENGEEALKIFKEGTFDLLLTDYDVEKITGIELAARIKEINPDITTVLLSGWMLSEISSYKNIIDLFISKPFRLDDLIQKISGLLLTKAKDSI